MTTTHAIHITKKGITAIILSSLLVGISYSNYSHKTTSHTQDFADSALLDLLLTRHTWEWTPSYETGKEIKPFTVIFSKGEPLVIVTTVCNEYRITYTHHDGDITFETPLQATSSLCNDELGLSFMQLFSNVTTFAISNHILYLKNNEGKDIIELRKQEKESNVEHNEARISIDDAVTLQTITIEPTAILKDSRCPSGAACITEGYVSARFTFSSREAKETKELREGESVVVFGKTITLQEVTPKPTLENSTELNYKFKIRVN